MSRFNKEMQLNNNIVNYIVSQKCPPHYFLNSYIKNKPTLIGWLVGLRFNGAFNKEWVISYHPIFTGLMLFLPSVL